MPTEHAWRAVALTVTSLVIAIMPLSVRAATVEMTVSRVLPNRGMVLASLCKEGLDREACKLGQRLPADAEVLVFTFPDVEPGRYAAVAFQDLHGDGILRRSRMGRPLEPYGLSNGAGRRRRPTFEQASVPVGVQRARIVVRLDMVTGSR